MSDLTVDERLDILARAVKNLAVQRYNVDIELAINNNPEIVKNLTARAIELDKGLETLKGKLASLEEEKK